MVLPVKPQQASPSVYLLQLALVRANTLAPSGIDGVYGNATGVALQEFQKRHSLDPDGVVGAKTYRALLPYLRGYVSHTVVSGDTFYRLARHYGTDVKRIAAANPSVRPSNMSVGTRLIVPLPFPVVSGEVPFTSEYLGLITGGLAARYPFLRTSTVGKSVMGAPLTVFTLGSGGTEVFVNASHHANEWITSPVVAKFVEDYAEALAFGGVIGGQAASALSARTTLCALPLVNPDGADLVTGELSSGAYYEAARRISDAYPNIPFPSGWKANISGTDLNLNYPAGWDKAREIKFAQGYTSPAPRDYVGSAPLSAPESRAVCDFTRSRDFALTLSYHTQGEVIYWRYLDYEPEGAEEIGRRLAAVSGYSLESTPYASGFAGYKDWFIQDYNRPGYTVEAGKGDNPLPLRDFPSIYRQNAPLIASALALAER